MRSETWRIEWKILEEEKEMKTRNWLCSPIFRGKQPASINKTNSFSYEPFFFFREAKHSYCHTLL